MSATTLMPPSGDQVWQADSSNAKAIENAARICRLIALQEASPAGSAPAMVLARLAAGICRAQPWSDTRRSACGQMDWLDPRPPQAPAARPSTPRPLQRVEGPAAIAGAQSPFSFDGSTCAVSYRLMSSGERPGQRVRVSWQALG